MSSNLTFKTLGLITKPADLILPNKGHQGALYLGSLYALDPAFLKKHNIHVVISMTQIQKVPGVIHYQFPLPDHRSANRYMQKMLPQIISLINAHIRAGHNVLVHCQAGIHRAPTVIAHYLQQYERMSLDRAVKTIRKARPVALYDGSTFDLKNDARN
jgi:protein tyrosine/serine phosphatase